MKKLLDVALLVFVSVLLLSMSAFAQPNDVGTISGTVTVQDLGDPIMGAVVKAYHVDGHPWPAAMTWSNSMGNYELTVPYDDYHVKAHKWGFFPEWWEEAPCRVDATPVTVSEENNPEGINFTLEPIVYGGIAGTITDATTEEPITWAWVVATNTEEPYFHRWAVTDGNGEYDMVLPSGTYNIEARAFGYLPGSLEEPVVVEDTVVTGVDIALMPIIYGSISGTVYDSTTGETIAHARIRARMIDGWYGGYARSDSAGDYTLERLRPGDYRLTAFAYGYFPKVYPDTITVVGDENVPGIDFYLVSSSGPFDGYISGTVTDEETSEPVADAFLVAFGSGSWHHFHVRFTHSGDDGSYIFENLPPLEYKIFCMASGYLWEFYDDKDSWWDANIVIPDAENIDFALAPSEAGPRVLAGHVFEDGATVTGALVFAKQDGEVKDITITYPDGSYIFEGLNAGSYSVEVLSPSLSEGSLEEVVVLFSDVYGADIILETTIVDDSDGSLPISTTLKQNFPNPFNASTTISFNLARDTKVELSIYDLLGRKVTTLISDNMTAGLQTIAWNGKDATGNPVATGLYLYVLKTDEGSQGKQMLLLK